MDSQSVTYPYGSFVVRFPKTQARRVGGVPSWLGTVGQAGPTALATFIVRYMVRS